MASCFSVTAKLYRLHVLIQFPGLDCGIACEQARKSLSAVNAFWWLYADKKKSHWLKQHGGAAAGRTLGAAKEGPHHITDDRLNQVAVNPLTAEWLAEHKEELGEDGLRNLNDVSLKDLFEPGDISSNLANVSDLFVRNTLRDPQVQCELYRWI